MPIDYDNVRPSVDDVALLERSRTVGAVGLGGDAGTGGTFTETTRPNSTEVEELIDLALDLIVPPLSSLIQTPTDPQARLIRRAVSVQAAVLIEQSFFREAADRGSVQAWNILLATLLGYLGLGDQSAQPGGGGGELVPQWAGSIPVTTVPASTVLAPEPEWPPLWPDGTWS